MKFRATIRAAAIGSAAAIALAGCGGGDTGTEATPVEVTPVTAAAPTVQSTPVESASGAANAVFVPLADGTQFDFNSLQGQDVLLWFWAPW